MASLAVGDLAPVLDQITDGVIVFGADDRVRYFNVAWARMFEIEPGELAVGESVGRIFDLLMARGQLGSDPGELASDTVARRHAAWRSEGDRQERRELADGRVIDIFRSQATGGDIVCVHVDVTESVRRQEELNRQRELMSVLIENITDGVCMLDEGAHFIAFNRRFLELYEIDPARVRWGMHFLDFAREFGDIAHLDEAEREAEIARRLAFATDPEIMATMRPLGNGRVLDLRKTSLPGGDCVFTIHDVTETLDRERDLTEARLRAESANRHKSDFVARMSHEMRTPLHGVLGPAALLDRTVKDPRQRKLVEAISTSGEVLLRLIDDVLDLSRLDIGGLELVDRPFAICEVVRECIRVIEPEAADKGLAVVKDPNPGPVPEVRGDAVRLRQVLLHLMSNAVKFTEEGSLTVRLRVLPVEGSPDTIRALIEISDTGIGIADQDQARIFRQFVQVDQGITRRHGGAGLGLTITKRLVESMGGKISVRSAMGSGSCFSVSLPLRVLG